MNQRIIEYGIGIAGFIAALAIGHSYAIQFQPGQLQPFLF